MRFQALVKALKATSPSPLSSPNVATVTISCPLAPNVWRSCRTSLSGCNPLVGVGAVQRSFSSVGPVAPPGAPRSAPPQSGPPGGPPLDAGAGSGAPAAKPGPVLIVGLGNYGPEYTETRHSVGIMAIKFMAQLLHVPLTQHPACQAFAGTLPPDAAYPPIALLYPTVQMNVSGQAVSCGMKTLAKSVGVPQSDVRLIVLQDDLEREFGKLSRKFGGSASGHNGVRSVIQALGGGGTANQFARFRVGVGRPKSHSKAVVADYVLEKFSSPELSSLRSTVFPRLSQEVFTHLGLPMPGQTPYSAPPRNTDPNSTTAKV